MMTQKKKNIIALLFCSALLAACGGSDKAEPIAFEETATEKATPLTNDNDAPQCQLSLKVAYAKTGNANTDKAVNNAIERELFGMEGMDMKAAADSFANQYAADYRKSLAPLYRADRNDKEKRSWYEYKYTVKTETAEGRKGVTVYKADIDYYEGGAHGVSLQTIFNFDNATGRRLALGDIFVPGSDKRLAEKLLEALEDKTGKKGIEELKAEGYLCTTDIYAPQNFIIGDDAITFVYNAYEIAPYDKGRIELTIDYDDLDILKKDF